MRARLVVLAVVLVIAASHLSRESGRALAPVPREPEDAPSTAAAPKGPASPSLTFTRDPFRFANEELAAREDRARSLPAAPAASPPPEPSPARVRLVGFIRRGGVLRAALSVDGEVVLTAPGETTSGFRVLSVDEEGGVRILDPEGSETTLTLAEEP
jgi:hypothetical protein